MIDKIVLGLLTKKDLTVYDIKIAMEQSINRFYSNSFGSINPAMKKLEQGLYITCSESIENGRLRRVYKITDKGRAVFRQWISEPIKQGRFKDEVLIRIFFLGDANKKEQRTLITDYLEELSSSKKDLEGLKLEINESGLSSQQLKEVKFQISTLQFGIDYLNFKQTWFQNLLQDI